MEWNHIPNMYTINTKYKLKLWSNPISNEIVKSAAMKLLGCIFRIHSKEIKMILLFEPMYWMLWVYKAKIHSSILTSTQTHSHSQNYNYIYIVSHTHTIHIYTIFLSSFNHMQFEIFFSFHDRKPLSTQ